MAIDPIYSDAARRGEDAILTEGWRNYGSLTDMALASFGQSSLSLGAGIALTGAGVADLVGDEETQGALLKNVSQLNNARQKLLNYDDVGLAGNIWSAFWGLAPHLAAGAISPLAPAVTMGLSQLPTGIDLINKGVDTETAGTVAGLSIAASAAQALLPMAGTTLAKTAGLATGTVALGVAERKTMREILKQSGYINEAQMFDPFDKHAMPVDIVMALTFGAMGMRKFKALKKAFGEAQMGAAIDIQKLKDNKELMDYLSNKEFMEDFRQLAPEAKDAYSALDSYQNMIKNMPFDHKAPGELQKHMNALYKAMDDIVNGRPVDVSGEIKEEIGRKIQLDSAIKRTVDDTVKDTVSRVEQEIIPNLSQEAHANLLFEKLTPTDKIGDITRDELGIMLKEGNPKALEEIKKSLDSGQLTSVKLQDTVRDEILKQIGEGKTKEERDSIRANIAEIEPEINKLLKAEPGKEQAAKSEEPKQYLPDNPVLEQSGEAILKNKPDLTITEDSEGGSRTIKASDAIAEYKAAIDREVAKKDLYNQAIRCLLKGG